MFHNHLVVVSFVDGDEAKHSAISKGERWETLTEGKKVGSVRES